MKICIHRGSKEIGGNCIELESRGLRIVLDLGLPLNYNNEDNLNNNNEGKLNYNSQNEWTSQESKGSGEIPDIPGLDGEDPTLLGIFISHPHLDHMGQLENISKKVPVGMGAAGRRIIQAASKFLTLSGFNCFEETSTVPSTSSEEASNIQFTSELEVSVDQSISGWDYQSGKPIVVGPFKVTPIMVDHSAYDSYALLVEADGQKLLYSGDFRAHGRKSVLFDRMIQSPPKNIDVLLLEGSNIKCDISSSEILTERAKLPSEWQIENSLLRKLKQAAGPVFVHSSSQNIDRTVSIFRACRRAKKRLVMDLYTAAVLEATGNPRIPQSHWPEIALYVPNHQRTMVLKRKMFNLLKRHSCNRIYLEDLSEEMNSVILFRNLSQAKELERAGCIKDASYIWSMWEGYWNQSRMDGVKDWLSSHNISKCSIHTSGHACVEDLQKFVSSIKPAKVVPIHSFAPETFPTLFENVEPHNDGEWWTP